MSGEFDSFAGIGFDGTQLVYDNPPPHQGVASEGKDAATSGGPFGTPATKNHPFVAATKFDASYNHDRPNQSTWPIASPAINSQAHDTLTNHSRLRDPTPPSVARPKRSLIATYGLHVVANKSGGEDAAGMFGSVPTPLIVVEGEADEVADEVKMARDRAMQVIRNFQEAGRPLSDIGRKRKLALDKLEQRKRLAMVKNLEYLAKVEDDRLRTNLLKVHESQNQRLQMEAIHQQSLQNRLLHLGRTQVAGSNTSTVAPTQAGIGTQQRQRTERKRQQQQRLISTDTVAIYVSNLPTDGSVNEQIMHALFGSLGHTLRKIHIYTRKDTGEPKGDALMVYELPAGADRKVLTEDVCSQLNAAEMPCGTAIKVEPSDPLYKLRKKRKDDNHYGPVSKDNHHRVAVGDDDKDIDDFFESLVEDKDEEFSLPVSQVQEESRDRKEHGDGKEAHDTSVNNEASNIIQKSNGDEDLDEFFESL